MEKELIEPLILFGIIALVGLIVFFKIRRARHWKKHGIKTIAHVVKIQKSGRKFQNQIIWDVHIDVELVDKRLKRVYVDHIFEYGYAPPEVGDVLPVLVDSKDLSRVLIRRRRGT